MNNKFNKTKNSSKCHLFKFTQQMNQIVKIINSNNNNKQAYIVKLKIKKFK